MSHAVASKVLGSRPAAFRLCARCGMEIERGGERPSKDGLTLCQDCRLDRVYVQMAGRRG